jgi:hypothetical protein
MVGTTTGGPVRPGDEVEPEWVAEEVLPDEVPEEGEPLGDQGLGSLPDAADEADVVDQHTEVPDEDDDLDRGALE